MFCPSYFPGVIIMPKKRQPKNVFTLNMSEIGRMRKDWSLEEVLADQARWAEVKSKSKSKSKSKPTAASSVTSMPEVTTSVDSSPVVDSNSDSADLTMSNSSVDVVVPSSPSTESLSDAVKAVAPIVQEHKTPSAEELRDAEIRGCRAQKADREQIKRSEASEWSSLLKEFLKLTTLFLSPVPAPVKQVLPVMNTPKSPASHDVPVSLDTPETRKVLLNAMQGAIDTVKQGWGLSFFTSFVISNPTEKSRKLQDAKDQFYDNESGGLKAFITELARPRASLIGQANPAETNSYKAFVAAITSDGSVDVLKAVIQALDADYQVENQTPADLKAKLKAIAVDFVNAPTPQGPSFGA